MTGTRPYLLEPDLIWLAVLSSNYQFYDIETTSYRIFLKFGFL